LFEAVEGPRNQGIFTVNAMLISLAILLADDPPPQAGPPGGGNLLTSMLPMIVVFAAFWYFILYLPMKKERARQAALLAAIKKNDRVLTSGGIFGVVTNVSKESNEVTLRIDETTNAKLRVTLNSIAQVLGDETSADNPPK
jgi:preprotein translocase subunit YajC